MTKTSSRTEHEPSTTVLAPRLEDQLAGMDWSELDEERIAPFGTVGWLHGSKSGKTPGVFYARETEFAELPGAPWVPDDRFHEGKNPELGFSATELRIAFIGFRQQWFLPLDSEAGDDRERGRKTWLLHYAAGAKKQVEYLCFVEGVDAPMILSGSKPTKTVPFRDVLGQYRRGLLKQAGLRMRRTLPTWAFWLPIAGERDRDGKPVFTDAKDASGKSHGSFVTTPRLVLPPNAIDTLFVGPERLRYGMELRRQFDWWFKEQRLPDDVVEGEGEVMDEAPHPALPAPGQRNVPVVISDDSELPF